MTIRDDKGICKHGFLVRSRKRYSLTYYMDFQEPQISNKGSEPPKESEPSHSAPLPSPNGAQQSHLRCWPGSSFGCAFRCPGASRPLSFSRGFRVGYGLLVVFCFVGALYGLSKGKSGQEASKEVLLVSHREQSSSQQQQNQWEPMDSAAFCAMFYRSGM